MMTSTFPTTRTNSHNLKYGIRELQHKKEILINLESTLKKRITEFRQLCLKEGELTGHLPADYPLQPREPIPQVRRRITRSISNIPNEFSHHNSSSSGNLMPPPTSIPPSLHAKEDQVSYQVNLALPNANAPTHPSRPTSSNSTSSISTASSSLHNKHTLSVTGDLKPASMTTNRLHLSNNDVDRLNHLNDNDISITTQNKQQTQQHTAAIMLQSRQKKLQQQRQQQQMLSKHYDQLFTLPTHFKKPPLQPNANPNFDNDSLGHTRASSTASSSSSSGSAASSTVSAFAAVPWSSQRYVDMSLHGRSCSESVPISDRTISSGTFATGGSQTSVLSSEQNSSRQTMMPPVRPPRGLQNNDVNYTTITNDQKKLTQKQNSDSNINGLANRINDNQICNLENLNQEVTNFQPYYEETKPFQMSDFYKYSAKHRQQAAPEQEIHLCPTTKTTRQLQAEIATMKQPLKLTACDDQIQTSRKLIEQSGQKVKNATAKAIACNPSLAERFNNIISNHQKESY